APVVEKSTTSYKDDFNTFLYSLVRLLEANVVSSCINRQQIREMRAGQEVLGSQSFYNRLKDLFTKWIQAWVKEREPESAQEAAQQVETFLAAQRGSKSYRFEIPQKSSAARGKLSGSGVGGGPREPEPDRPHVRSVVPVKPKSSARPVCF
uniref:SCAN box domain-containing protein n=1 Tax=Acanthochromis polyacanthus TaxID=80966 RepID=A0A3Q1F2X9_9TELE